ncbi:MAG: hypothetical protein J5875_09315 [Paludibacteraceae bacterium]|nr:hypothetical protein [Paludibacteraceae bacterium]
MATGHGKRLEKTHAQTAATKKDRSHKADGKQQEYRKNPLAGIQLPDQKEFEKHNADTNKSDKRIQSANAKLIAENCQGWDREEREGCRFRFIVQ